MLKKRTTIIYILLSIILIIICIGIGIASANQLALAGLHLNATADLKPASELRGLTVRRGAVLLESNLNELEGAENQLLQLDVHKLS